MNDSWWFKNHTCKETDYLSFSAEKPRLPSPKILGCPLHMFPMGIHHMKVIPTVSTGHFYEDLCWLWTPSGMWLPTQNMEKKHRIASPRVEKSDMGSTYLPDFRNGLSGGIFPPISGFTGPYLYLVREPPCISDNSPMTNVLLFIGKRFRTSPPRALSARAARAWPVSTKHISWGPTLHMACLQIMMDKILWLQASSSLDGF